MYKSMKTLINKKFYKTLDDAQDKLNVFYAVDRLTADEYIELTNLVREIYEEA